MGVVLLLDTAVCNTTFEFQGAAGTMTIVRHDGPRQERAGQSGLQQASETPQSDENFLRGRFAVEPAER